MYSFSKKSKSLWSNWPDIENLREWLSSPQIQFCCYFMWTTPIESTWEEFIDFIQKLTHNEASNIDNAGDSNSVSL